MIPLPRRKLLYKVYSATSEKDDTLLGQRILTARPHSILNTAKCLTVALLSAVCAFSRVSMECCHEFVPPLTAKADTQVDPPQKWSGTAWQS